MNKNENSQFAFIEGGICAPKGFKAAGVHCGIRKNKGKADLALIVSDVMCNVAAVYTTNKIKGHHLRLQRKTSKTAKQRQSSATVVMQILVHRMA